MKIELFVRLIIPDNVAVTAKNTMQKMGFKFKEIKREDYYSFESDKDISKELAKIDILVNANKHRVRFKLNDTKKIKILVKDIDNPCTGILKILKERLGFDCITKCEHGTLWTITGTDKKTAECIAKNLLANENYQAYSIY